MFCFFFLENLISNVLHYNMSFGFCFVLAEMTTNRPTSISERDRLCIDALIAEENTLSPKKRHICNGRFLTMHKRRRKKLQTRSLAFEPAVLDDILHGQVTCILRQVGKWRFNAFTLETVTGGDN